MASSDAEFAPIRFSTEDLPEPDRFECWREALGRAVMNLEVDPEPDMLPNASMTLRALPGIDISRAKMPACGTGAYRR